MRCREAGWGERVPYLIARASLIGLINLAGGKGSEYFGSGSVAAIIRVGLAAIGDNGEIS